MGLFLAILEDDKNLLTYYKVEIEKFLKAHDVPGEVVVATQNPDLFLEGVKNGRANVCIIDINLRTNTNGMQVALEIRKAKVPAEIIFITGHLQYMKAAFVVRAFDYLEKPVTSERLAKCLLRLYKEISTKDNTKQEVIKVKSGTSIYHISVNDILFVEHYNYKSVIVTRNRRIETYETLANLAKELPDDKFKQCHRAIWVNTLFIDTVDLGKNEIILKNGMKCSIGKTFRKGFSEYEI
jgi:two-component system response regulator AgrA